jgi:hypothetical protein
MHCFHLCDLSSTSEVNGIVDIPLCTSAPVTFRDVLTEAQVALLNTVLRRPQHSVAAPATPQQNVAANATKAQQNHIFR